jgi:adenylate kinase
MKNIIFLGAPGSGKGTQAEMLAKELKIPAISTGDALRKEVEVESEIGKLAKSYMESGKLVPDEVVIGIIKNRIAQKDCVAGFILDGFPRNVNQAISLNEMLASLAKKIDLVFNFDVSEETLIKRISGRFSCKDCGSVYNRYFKLPTKEGVCDNCGSTHFHSRSDDNEATVKNRLKVYHESTFALIEFYQKNNLLVSIAAVKSAPLVFEALLDAIKKSQNNLN